MNGRRWLVLIFLTAFLLTSSPARAEFGFGASMSSSNFRILDGQHSLFGALASSASSLFGLLTTMGDLAIGSSSNTTFSLRSGFLYFPKVVAPVLNTATAGDTQVSLAWTAATASGGWTISGYNVCTQPSAGSYTCVSVGNVTSYTKTGLTNGTSHTFRVDAKDFFGNVIAQSNTLSATPTGAAPPPPPPGGGGGGGGTPAPTPGPTTGAVILRGYAFVDSFIDISYNGTQAVTVRAGADGKYEARITSVSDGTYIFNLATTDPNGRPSVLNTAPVRVISGQTVEVSNLHLPPTIELNPLRVPKGQIIRIFGYATPSSQVELRIDLNGIVAETTADSYGPYSIMLNTERLAEGEHNLSVRAIIEANASPFSPALTFVVEKKTDICAFKRSDLNKDCMVNYTDLSILLYWFNTRSAQGLQKADINKDGKVNIVDFSILLFEFTG